MVASISSFISTDMNASVAPPPSSTVSTRRKTVQKVKIDTMSTTFPESSGTLTSDSPTTPKKTSVRGKSEFSRSGSVYHKPNSPSSPPTYSSRPGTRHDSVSSFPAPRRSKSTPKDRFKKAFVKSLITRSRVLGRRLTRAEFQRLTLAVRKQISRRFRAIDHTLALILDRIIRLENATPQSPLELQDSIGMFAAQVSVLREQALLAIQERDEISEGCSHFSKKRLFSPKSEVPVFSIKITGLDLIGPRVSDIETLACPKCTEKREEAVFYWTGCDTASFNSICYSSREVDLLKDTGLLKVSPMSIQNVWSAVLNQHFSRQWKTPASK